MFTNQTVLQIDRGRAPLAGRGTAPVVARQGEPNLSAFVTADLRFDFPAIRAAAKARYALKLDFINRYTGAPKRYWQIAQARRAIASVWSGARAQHHRIVWQRLPHELPYTRAETGRLTVLRARMASAPITGPGNAAYKAAASEYGAICHAAQRRAYLAVLAQVQVA